MYYIRALIYDLLSWCLYVLVLEALRSVLVKLGKYMRLHTKTVETRRDKNEVRYSIVLNSIHINLFYNCMKNARLISKYNCFCQKRDKLKLRFELFSCIPKKLAY